MSTQGNSGIPNSWRYYITMFISVKVHIKAYINWKGILLFFFSVLTNYSFPQSYNFRTFSSEDGMIQSYVYSIIQDTHGYLWVGTDNGLFRYNGFKIEKYATSDSLTDNIIACSLTDEESLWFGHRDGRLSYFNGTKFLPVNNTLPDLSAITHLAKSPDSQVWASTYSDGLLKLSKDIGVLQYYRFKEQANIISFDFLDNSELLVGTNSGLLYCRLKETGEIEIIRPVLEIPESKVTFILKMRNDTGFYIATENDGIFQLTNKDKLFKVKKIIADTDFDFSDIQDIYEDSHSNLWICSKGNGLTRMSYSASGELSKIIFFNKANGFVTDNTKTVFEDREGNIWSGNFGDGLTLITPKTFSVYRFDNPLYGNNIFSIYINRQYRWIGTENGLIKMDQETGKIIKFYGTGSGLPKDTVTTIYSTDGKELWIGTGRNGVFNMDIENERILKYPIENGILENSITIITGLREQLWIGTKKGLLNSNTSTNSKNWYTINQGGLPHNYINCLYIDRTDKLWVSTPGNTLAYIKDEKVVKMILNPSKGNLILGPITEDTDSRIWVGSKGNGVFMIESDSIANFTMNEGLLSNYCYSIICDDQKNIWVGHKGGLSKIRTIDFLVKPIQNMENLSDNYQFNPNAIFKDQEVKIWFGSDKGLISYDPSMEHPDLLPPVLSITSIKINDEETGITDKIILSPGRYKIKIDFLGISLKEPTLVTYQYKLEGYDQLSEITKNTNRTYNLTEGDYTFILKASSGDGAVSENPLTINIIIKKPVWKKWWFYPMTGLLLIILVYIYFKRREYKFLAEKRILEEKVIQRTAEIQRQKNEIELQRDLIHEKNADITGSIKYAKRIQNAVLPPMELIDKLLPDNFIFFRPKDIVSGDFYWLTEMNDKIIFTVGDCTGHGVPGAFMSLLGITFLNEIVNILGITNSDAIVSKLREKVIHSLKQNKESTSNTDGMDLALCVLDKKQKRIQYTGAMRHLVYIRDGQLEVIKANKMSVSISFYSSTPFSLNEMDYRKGDIFYLFSDGYQDQFGGDKDRKYLITQLYNTLIEIHKLPMVNQREMLELKLNEWIKNGVQTDDVTVMGIRL